KLEGPLYHCFLDLTLESQLRERLGDLTALASHPLKFSEAGHNQVRYHQATDITRITDVTSERITTFEVFLQDGVKKRRRADWREMLLVLHPAEIAALWHLPHEGFTARSIAWAGPTVPEVLTVAGNDR